MFKAFLKVLFRNSLRNKKTFLINILGLSIGLTCFFLIYVFVQHEFSYDKFHKNSDNIYRIVMKQPGNIYFGSDMFNVTPGLLQPMLKEKFPEIINAARVRKNEHLVQNKQNSFIENRFLYVDPDFLKIFSFKVLAGDPNEILKKPFTVVLSEKIAEKYFGNTDPLGKYIKLDTEDNYEITGIIEDAPDNSHIKYDFLASFSSQEILFQRNIHWNNNNYQTYVQLADHISFNEVENKITEITQKLKGHNNNEQFILQPLTDIHLKANCNFELEKNGDIKQVNTFYAIGILILLIACFNYVNLTSSGSISRSKEFGIKKIVGADKKQFFYQLIGESFIHTLLSSLIAIIFIYLILHLSTNFIPNKFSLSFLSNFRILSGLIISILATSVISGILPALFMIKLQPVQIIKNKAQSSSFKFFNIRSIFVVTQFVISISLIIGTIYTYQQLKFLQNKDLGYQTNNIITTFLYGNNSREKYDIIKKELLSNPDVFDVTFSNFLPNEILSSTSANLENEPENKFYNIYRAQVDYNFFDFYGISMKDGTGFKDFENTNKDIYVLNNTALDNYNINNAVGKILKTNDRNVKGEIVGVINDIYFSTLNLKMCPLAISNIKKNNYQDARYLSIKVNPEKFESTIPFIKNKIKEFSPDYPFSYNFLSSNIESKYSSEKRFQYLFSFFSIIAVCIACLGLFGLATYNLEKRIKEIGVRKVNGAKVTEILALINKDYIIWIAVSFIISGILTRYVLEKWLQNYAYHIKISWWLFVLAGIITLGIALITVSWQSWLAAKRNPVETLRYE